MCRDTMTNSQEVSLTLPPGSEPKEILQANWKSIDRQARSSYCGSWIRIPVCNSTTKAKYVRQ